VSCGAGLDFLQPVKAFFYDPPITDQPLGEMAE